MVGLCRRLVGRQNIGAVLFSQSAALRHFCAQSSTSHQHFQNKGDESTKRAQDRRSKEDEQQTCQRRISQRADKEN